VKAGIRLEYDPPQTPRVLQVGSLFDVPLDAKLALHLDADLPVEDREWSIGLVVGPSGAGKSTLVRELWPGAVLGEQEWADDAALVDCFPPGMSIKEITGLLSAVGLSTIPSWLRPYRTLSTGEAFRASIARALAETDGLLIVDEFSSTVDRQVAKVASHALQKTIRRIGRQLVAVTCHYDVTEWLQPDFVYDVAAGEFTWGCKRPRPPIRIEIFPADRSAWPRYRRFHYLDANLSSAAQCFEMFADGTPCGFNSYLHLPHARVKNIKLAHREVILPDWQGLGLGPLFADWMGQFLYERRFRLHYAISQPVLIRAFTRSPRWRECGSKPRLQVGPKSQMRARQLDPRRLSSRVFEYVAPRTGSSALG
jgi:energy-coupling factor transporter ATP-binding protein EcfA2